MGKYCILIVNKKVEVGINFYYGIIDFYYLMFLWIFVSIK